MSIRKYTYIHTHQKTDTASRELSWGAGAEAREAMQKVQCGDS